MRRTLAALIAAALAFSGFAVAAQAATAKPAPAAAELKGQPMPEAKGKVRLSNGKVQALFAGPYYHYTDTWQYIGTGANTSGADGVAVLASQHNPYVQSNTGAGGQGHSLWEVAAQSGDLQNTVEVGIRKTGAAGSVPRLFVYTWVGGVGQGYDAANPGWIDNPGEAVDAGTALAYTAAGAAPSVYYQYRIERTTLCSGGGASGSGTGWRIIQKNQGAADRIIGCFTDAAWTGATPAVTDFQKIGRLQIYGESVSTNDPNTCTDLAGGVYGTSTSPSAAGDQLAYSLISAPAGETNVPDGVSVLPSSSSPNAYRIWQDPADLDRIRWGGPGFAGPDSDFTTVTAGSVGSC